MKALKDTRRRASKEELLAIGNNASLAETVLQHWTDTRLLTTTRDFEKGTEIVEVAHEAMIRAWPLVREWKENEREQARLIGHLRYAVAEWQDAVNAMIISTRARNCRVWKSYTSYMPMT